MSNLYKNILAKSSESDQKIIRTYIDANGRIVQFPKKRKKLEVLLKHVLQSFNVGIHYSESEVNTILLNFTEDFSGVRRDLIDFKFIARNRGGEKYQVVASADQWVPWDLNI